MVAVAPAPTARVPMAQVTTPPDCEQVPCVELAEKKFTVAGKLSVSTTPGAAAGAVLKLFTVTVYVRLVPAVTGLGFADLVTSRSNSAFTVVEAEAELFVEFGSGSFPDTETVFVMVPAEFGMMTIVTVAPPFRANVPRTQVTILPDREQLP